MKREEKQNRNKALAASIAVHSILLLIIFMAIAWRAPNPPHPQYGIEINFGTSDVGSGALQPETTPTTTDQQQSAENQEETVEDSQKETTKDEVNPSKAEPVETESPSKIESTVKAKTSEKDAKVTEPVKEIVKETVKKETETKTTTETKPVEKEKSDQTDGKDKESNVTSQGDNKDKVGDKGKEDGSLDAKALYGQQGGGGGSSLELSGWEWDRLPKPQTTRSETGRIVFEIKVDDQGELISYRITERSVSIEAERACIAEIEKLSFIKKSGAMVPAVSTGRITFVFTAK
jgi:periplasmic protein TonB